MRHVHYPVVRIRKNMISSMALNYEICREGSTSIVSES